MRSLLKENNTHREFIIHDEIPIYQQKILLIPIVQPGIENPD